MIRIFINGRYLTQPITGVQRCATETVRALDRLIASGEYPRDAWTFTLLMPPSAAQPDLSAIAVRKAGYTRGQMWEQLELPVHAKDGLLLSFANTAPLAARRQCVTIHDASVFAIPDGYRPVFRAWYRFLLPALGRRAERILTDSRFSRDELIRWARVPEEKLAVIPLAGEHILAAPSDEGIVLRHGLRHRPYIVAVSSGSTHKNLEGITRAMAVLQRDDYDLVMVGAHTSSVFNSVEAGSQARVRRLGYITDRELRAIYENARALVYPSLYEGFGLPPLEAMACGCPVIVSNVASLPEVCGDAALYCDPRDPQQIAARIADLLDQPRLREELRTRALLRSRQFRWVDTARAVLKEIEGLARPQTPVSAPR